MTTAERYVILENSNATLIKRFRVIKDGYKPVVEKAQSISRTMGGIDVAMGSLYETHQYVFFLREEEPTNEGETSGSNYGTKEDLKTFYSYINPSGVPSNKIKFTDHYGNIRYVYMLGQYAPEAVTTIIVGTYAWFLIAVLLQVIPDAQL